MTKDPQEQQDEFNASLLRALETPPQIVAPQDFAARVMARIPQEPKTRQRFANVVSTAPGYGRKAIFGALAVLVAIMFVVTPAAGTSRVWMTLELVLLAQLGIFVLWLGFSRRNSRL